MPDSTAITPHWLLNLLGVKRGNINFTDAGVDVSKGKRKQGSVDSQSLISQCKATEGAFFSGLKFHTDNGAIIFRGLARETAKRIYTWLQRHAYQLISTELEINDLANQLEDELQNRYVRSSAWPSIKTKAKRAVNCFDKVPEEGLIDEADRESFATVYKVSKMGDKELEGVREKYVERCKRDFDSYFSRVESNPLTGEQRTACIIDEDNNLVLASAGTGKTSTMIGRAGFLLESGQAKGNEILMLAFTNQAAKEIQERLKERIGSEDITAVTFHKLGKNIVADVEGVSPSITPYANDDNSLPIQVDQWVNEMLEQGDYLKDALKYFESYMYVEKNPFDFQTEGDYFNYLRNNAIRTLKVKNNDVLTLKGELVKGHGERIIANHLFKMGIEYQYEEKYEHNTRELDYSQYRPDFFLPKYGVYIEHFGISEDGSTAPYVNRDEYHASMRWKREIHQRYDTQLVETYFHEHMAGSLRELLTRRLEELDLGIEFNPIPDEEVLSALRRAGEITEFAKLMTDLLLRCRENHETQESLNQRIKNSPYPEHMEAALTLLNPIMTKYQKTLDDNEEIDFSDMIGKALDYVESAKFKSPWKYILVDEFQDISAPQARLISALKKSASNCSLYCVGDDWQAIYRFTGSDILFTTRFESFGPAKKTVLKETFRFNNSISDISSKFISKNPDQTKKQISTKKRVKSPAVSLLRQSRKILSGESPPWRKILENISKEDDTASVLILGRYKHTLEVVETDGLLNESFPKLHIKCQTIHASKGKEADYVMVLDLESGKWGFPSEKTTNPLLEALLPEQENFEFAEERRLFYVALTRAKRRAYLVTDMSVASKFVIELIEGDYKIELNEFDVPLSQRFYKKIHCVRCETGILQARKGRNGNFYGCSNYLLCRHTENGCGFCGQPMTRFGDDYKICIDPECTAWTPLCPECGAEMMSRENPRTGNQFWGCQNYGSDNLRSCNYTRNHIPPPPR